VSGESFSVEYCSVIIEGDAHAPTVIIFVKLPGEPRELRAGPSLPALVKTVIPQSRNAFSNTFDTLPLSGCQLGSPKERFTRSHPCFFAAIKPRINPVPVSALPSRPSPIFSANICAPGATPFKSLVSSSDSTSSGLKYDAAIPATCVPCDPESVTMLNVFPSSYT